MERGYTRKRENGEFRRNNGAYRADDKLKVVESQGLQQPADKYTFPRTIVLPKFTSKKNHLEPMKDQFGVGQRKDTTRKLLKNSIRVTSKKATFMLNEIKKREVVHEATVEEQEDSGGSKIQNNQDVTYEEANVSEIDQLTTKHIMLPKIKELKSAIAKIIIRDFEHQSNRKGARDAIVKLGEAPLSERIIAESQERNFDRSRTLGDDDHDEESRSKTDRCHLIRADNSRRIWRHRLPEPPAGFPYRPRPPASDTKSLSIESKHGSSHMKEEVWGGIPKRNYLLLKK